MAKRFTDVLVSSLLLLASSPILAAACVWILIDDGGPILFSQSRIGLGGRAFKLYKLRTLRLNAVPYANIGQVTEENALVLRSGRFLRRLKIDEIPQFINVLKGDMSLVGPRPTVAEQVAAYSQLERRRLELRPGISGWAQVNGGTALGWPDRIALDIWYVDHRSFALDVMILLRTAVVLLSGDVVREAALSAARQYQERARSALAGAVHANL